MEPISFFEAAKKVKQGEVGVVPTDTLYGLVASALLPEAVERTYRIRGRELGKPCIVLLSDVAKLDVFGIGQDEISARMLGSVWPGPVSAVLPCTGKEWGYLHRGTGTIAFRVPGNAELRAFLREAGPVIAPSANPAGADTATTVGEALGYFGSGIGFIVDGGRLSGLPSTVARIVGGKWEIIRQGAVIL